MELRHFSAHLRRAGRFACAELGVRVFAGGGDSLSGRLSWVGFSEYVGHWGYREQWDFTDLFGFEGHSKESGSPRLPPPPHTH